MKKKTFSQAELIKYSFDLIEKEGWSSFSPLSEPNIKKTFDLYFRRTKYLGF